MVVYYSLEWAMNGILEKAKIEQELEHLLANDLKVKVMHKTRNVYFQGQRLNHYIFK